MHDSWPRLAIALTVSGALHLSLIFGTAVRAPVPLASPLLARLQPAPLLPVAASAIDTFPVPLASALDEARPPEPRPERGPAPEVEPAGPVVLPAQPPEASLPSVEMPLLVDPTWYSAKQLDLFPHPLGPVQPAYPEPAAQDGIRGEVTLLLLVDELGTVREASVVQAAPEGYFEEAAITAFVTAHFAPAQKDGRSVRSRVLVRVSFDPLAFAEKQGRPAPGQADTKSDE